MNTEELLVHNSCQGQTTEGFHARIVDLLRVFVLAFEFEGEVVCQMPALMVATEEPEGIGVPDLERPQVKDALKG